MKARLLVTLGAVAVVACGDTGTEAPTIRSFDRPVDVAFGCYGKMRVLADGVEVFSPMPLGACTRRALGGGDKAIQEPVPAGQEGITNDNQFWYALAVQPTAGTVTVVNAKLVGPAEDDDGSMWFIAPGYNEGAFTVEDSDDLIPGFNALTVGSNPVAIATDTAGCHVLTANAGTCDLSVIDLEQVRANDGTPIVTAASITAGGLPLLARPAAIAAVDLASPVGVACPATPVGIHYVSYPDCHAVAAIDAATGAVVASIRFAADGTATLGDGNLVCPRQCGARDAIVAGARPIALDVVRDDRVGTQKLAIGLANRPVVTVVTLAADGRPASVQQVDLDGDVGVIDVALSAQITMGGTDGRNDGDATASGDDAQFVYAVASDGTVRVVEILIGERECDTQVDPRYLLDVQDVNDLICMGVGEVGTPPRRAQARGPGIEFNGAARPVAVAIGTNDHVTTDYAGADVSAPAASELLSGHFAYVALSNGFTFVVNIDDDNVADYFVPSQPLASQLPLTQPHQIRDTINERGATAVRQSNPGAGTRNCAAVAPDLQPDNAFLGGPRADSAPVRVIPSTTAAATKGYVLPYFRQGLCSDTSVMPADERPLPDTSFAAVDAVRRDTFPDLRATTLEEDWSFTWEGRLSLDRTDITNSIDGPQVRNGLVDIGGGGISIVDAAAPYCAAGVEPRDLVTLLGCDPARGDAQCGLGETCYVHPDATIATGACLPADQAEALGGRCRDFLVSLRRFAVQDPFASRLTLRERIRELRTTPVTGCTSDDQCKELARYEETLLSPEHPRDIPLPPVPPPPTTPTYACEPDRFRTTAVNRCVMTCQRDDQCAAGTLCRAGHCVEGIVPSPECAAGLQRYDVRGADALVAIGSRTGYLHSIIADAGTGRCVKDPAAHPLMIGRIPLTAPPCAGGGPTDLTPNPCSLTVDHVERVADYAPGTCDDRDPQTDAVRSKIVTRSTSAIRFRNPMMNLTLVDPTYPGDAMCRNDRGGTLVDVPTVSSGLDLRFRLVAGLQSRVLGQAVAQPTNVVRAPDQSVWVVDGGDLVSGNANLRGQLVRVSPRAPGGSLLMR